MELAVEHRTPSAQQDETLRDVLDRLGEKIKPVSMAREQTLPVTQALSRIFPEGGLVRGRVVSCSGAAATSIAGALVRDAVVAGAWLAVVDVDTFGVDAAAEIGIALERVVRIDAGSGSELDWIDVMGAAVDGFDIIVTRVPTALCGERRPAAVRKLASRVQQRGAVVVTLGPTGALTCDIELVTSQSVWSGLDDGSGHLRRRRVDVDATGRRLPGRRTWPLLLAGSNQRIEISAVEMAENLDTDRGDRRLVG